MNVISRSRGSKYELCNYVLGEHNFSSSYTISSFLKGAKYQKIFAFFGPMHEISVHELFDLLKKLTVPVLFLKIGQK